MVECQQCRVASPPQSRRPDGDGPPFGSRVVSRLRRTLLGLSPDTALRPLVAFLRAENPARLRLEHIVRSFVRGYHAALEATEVESLASGLDRVEASHRGFAYEGAAMGVRLRDMFVPRGRRWFLPLLEGPGAAHAYVLHVGAGCAAARLRRSAAGAMDGLDPLLGWLAVDGYGFHEGYFRWRRYHVERRAPRARGYARQAFDQGLGRSLWFVAGADAKLVVSALERFPAERRRDLWSGIGLACAYAGGCAASEACTIGGLLQAAGSASGHFAQGVAFAVEARHRAGDLAAHTTDACWAVWGLSPGEVARIVALAREAADAPRPDGSHREAYERWRHGIREAFASSETRGATAGRDRVFAR